MMGHFTRSAVLLLLIAQATDVLSTAAVHTTRQCAKDVSSFMTTATDKGASFDGATFVIGYLANLTSHELTSDVQQMFEGAGVDASLVIGCAVDVQHDVDIINEADAGALKRSTAERMGGKNLPCRSRSPARFPLPGLRLGVHKDMFEDFDLSISDLDPCGDDADFFRDLIGIPPGQSQPSKRRRRAQPGQTCGTFLQSIYRAGDGGSLTPWKLKEVGCLPGDVGDKWLEDPLSMTPDEIRELSACLNCILEISASDVSSMTADQKTAFCEAFVNAFPSQKDVCNFRSQFGSDLDCSAVFANSWDITHQYKANARRALCGCNKERVRGCRMATNETYTSCFHTGGIHTPDVNPHCLKGPLLAEIKDVALKYLCRVDKNVRPLLTKRLIDGGYITTVDQFCDIIQCANGDVMEMLKSKVPEAAEWLVTCPPEVLNDGDQDDETQGGIQELSLEELMTRESITDPAEIRWAIALCCQTGCPSELLDKIDNSLICDNIDACVPDQEQPGLISEVLVRYNECADSSTMEAADFCKAARIFGYIVAKSFKRQITEEMWDEIFNTCGDILFLSDRDCRTAGNAIFRSDGPLLTSLPANEASAVAVAESLGMLVTCVPFGHINELVGQTCVWMWPVVIQTDLYQLSLEAWIKCYLSPGDHQVLTEQMCIDVIINGHWSELLPPHQRQCLGTYAGIIDLLARYLAGELGGGSGGDGDGLQCQALKEEIGQSTISDVFSSPDPQELQSIQAILNCVSRYDLANMDVGSNFCDVIDMFQSQYDQLTEGQKGTLAELTARFLQQYPPVTEECIDKMKFSLLDLDPSLLHLLDDVFDAVMASLCDEAMCFIDKEVYRPFLLHYMELNSLTTLDKVAVRILRNCLVAFSPDDLKLYLDANATIALLATGAGSNLPWDENQAIAFAEILSGYDWSNVKMIVMVKLGWLLQLVDVDNLPTEEFCKAKGQIMKSYNQRYKCMKQYREAGLLNDAELAELEQSKIDAKALHRRLVENCRPSGGQGGGQGGIRVRRAVDPKSCYDMISLGEQVTSLADDEFSSMSGTDFADCLALFGGVSGWTTDQKSLLATLAKQHVGDPSTWTTQDVDDSGYVSMGLPDGDISSLDFSDHKAVHSLGSKAGWTDVQLVNGYANYKTTHSLGDADLAETDVHSLGHFLCGATPSELALIPSTIYENEAYSIGKLDSCEPAQLATLAGHAKVAFGSSSDWTQKRIVEVGNVIGGLTCLEISSLSGVQMEFILPETIKTIPMDLFACFSTSQLQNFDASQARGVTSQQWSALSGEQQEKLNSLGSFYIVNVMDSAATKGTTFGLELLIAMALGYLLSKIAFF